MGFIHDSHGKSQISVESRQESFRIHPAYGYEIICPTCHGEPLMGGECIECGGYGQIEYLADQPFGQHWREQPHPEFLLEDVPDLIRALADLETCPESVRQAIQAETING
jgi:hypothetical protein